MERKVSFQGLDAIMAQDINLILDLGCITVDVWMSLTTQQWGKLCIHSCIYNTQNITLLIVNTLANITVQVYACTLLFLAQDTAGVELLVIDQSWREWTMPSCKELASLHQVHHNSQMY